ncbi:S41 family peptidase [Actinocorallia libanotica]|uniref:Tail specific protease domain-containing protein n=1 Tax=Actinocorallia libanotica TaxID=46162 RepID=A0ABN1REV1_9ACTN
MTRTDPEDPAPGIDPGHYLAEVLQILEQRALDRAQVDWARFRQVPVASLDDAHTVITRAVEALGNKHTFFLTPQAAEERRTRGSAQENPLPSGRMLEERFAYLDLPSVAGSPEFNRHYTAAGAALIRGLDVHDPDGWIIDLRGNGGGNMYPMLTVVAPLLDDGHLGSFLDADGSETSRWELHDGEILHQESSRSPVPNPYTLRRPRPRTALLTGPSTASAAEATLISFLGLPDVRTFGEPTGGYATSNECIDLPDGARLVLTCSREADRLGRVYDNIPIPPDEHGQDALALALAWLR